MIVLFIIEFFIFKDWDDYWNDEENVEHKQYNYVSQKEPLSFTSQNLHIFSSIFRNITSSSILYIYHSKGSKLLIERSSFIECKTTDDFGASQAIYFCSGNYIFSKVCGIKWNADRATFAHCIVSSNCKGRIIQSSFNLCNSEGDYIIYHYEDGPMNTELINLSYNKCEYGSGIWYLDHSDSITITSYIKYSSLTNNTSTEKNFLTLNNQNSEFYIEYTNILSNQCPKNAKYGLIFTFNAVIKHSTILYNEGSPIFEISKGGSSIEIFNCTVGSDQITSGAIRGTVNIHDKPKTSFINKLAIITELHCYDSPRQTPIRTPPKSPKETPKRTPINTPISTPKPTYLKTQKKNILGHKSRKYSHVYY